jgi:hypothetical protein
MYELCWMHVLLRSRLRGFETRIPLEIWDFGTNPAYPIVVRAGSGWGRALRRINAISPSFSCLGN